MITAVDATLMITNNLIIIIVIIMVVCFMIYKKKKNIYRQRFVCLFGEFIQANTVAVTGKFIYKDKPKFYLT